jgi:hypothetical protein
MISYWYSCLVKCLRSNSGWPTSTLETIANIAIIPGLAISWRLARDPLLVDDRGLGRAGAVGGGGGDWLRGRDPHAGRKREVCEPGEKRGARPTLHAWEKWWRRKKTHDGKESIARIYAPAARRDSNLALCQVVLPIY